MLHMSRRKRRTSLKEKVEEQNKIIRDQKETITRLYNHIRMVEENLLIQQTILKFDHQEDIARRQEDERR